MLANKDKRKRHNETIVLVKTINIKQLPKHIGSLGAKKY